MEYDLTSDDTVHSHARAFSTHPAFRLAAAVDPGAERRRVFESRYEAPVYSSIADALRHHEAQLVVIAVPTSDHAAVLAETLACSAPLAVLCEKPLANDLEQARSIVAACAARGIHLFVNFVRRSEPGVIEVKRRIDAGAIATPARGVAWYAGGWIHNASHFVNLLEYWLGPTRAAALLPGPTVSGSAAAEPDVRVEFERGTVVFLATPAELSSHHSVELVTPNGRLRYDYGGESIVWRPALPMTGLAGGVDLEREPCVIRSDMGRYQWHVADQIAVALAGGDFELCTGTEALTSLESMLRVVNGC